MVIVSLQNIKFSFENSNSKKQNDVSLPILKDVNLEVKKGEYCLINGPSGSGKTTLLQIISAIIHQTKGQRIIFDKNLSPDSSREKIYAVRKRIGFLFQTPFLHPQVSVKEFIEFQAGLTGVGLQTAKENAESLLEEFEIMQFSNLLPKSLSAGERQRVALVSLLVKNIDLLLLDEPTGSLDEENKTIVWEQIKALRKKNITVIAVSHDVKVKQYFKKRYLLDYGILKKL
ncbi:MAG: ATP-binding cassette domain-containing protein [Candidatus Heimdallarchaeota archaeon]|nr:ATP-binding cassette domain-containing protein [Candidatus Heimdallarchaeota archaeon]MBY8994624.1 ATP-binding cassette domain-containing protein [Candidatus Heimdallarchaeota archaeon]NPE09821.1 ATP-binding cassette domain-containing protein [Asgard group archaeon]